MSETQHTPGPWQIQPNGAAYNLCRSDNGAHFGILVGMLDMADGEHEANARLMARAPELQEERDALLAACKALLAAPHNVEALSEVLRDAILPAIAKAEGRK